MSDEEILKIMEDLKLEHEEIEKWKVVLPELEPDEKKELAEILKQSKSERNILAARQSEELIDLMQSWKK